MRDEGSKKNVITGELIYMADIAYQMRDVIDWETKARTQLKFNPVIEANSFVNFIENFSGFFLRTRTYIKNEKLVEEIREMFKHDIGNPRRKTAEYIFTIFEEYIDAINRSELMKLIKEATSLQEQ